MLNPIQSVLAAERSAQDQVERARGESEATLKQARKRSREIVERSEKRTHRAVTRFEKQRAKAVTGEILRMRRQHRQELQRHVSKINATLEQMVEDMVERFWPPGV